jgi:hypothetical protein
VVVGEKDGYPCQGGAVRVERVDGTDALAGSPAVGVQDAGFRSVVRVRAIPDGRR